ncbi:MAG: hydrogenase maturation peptidase HycI [Candidatus Diapherotrites archaeon]|nr:hydrogenase maturation peptidase HycI [Candidatus Diapherotrites archaeon]
MNILLCVGNIMRGDDGVGPYIAKKFKKSEWLCIDSGTAPENFTGVIKQKGPELLVIVDIADMGLEPGAVRIINKESIPRAHFSTHSIPLSFFIDYVQPYCGEVILIGIQKKESPYRIGLSKKVKEAADKLIKIISDEEWDKLNQL